MGFFDDFSKLFAEADELRKEISDEISTIRDEVKESFNDIDEGARKKVSSIKQTVAHPLASSLKGADSKKPAKRNKIDVK